MAYQVRIVPCCDDTTGLAITAASVLNSERHVPVCGVISEPEVRLFVMGVRD